MVSEGETEAREKDRGGQGTSVLFISGEEVLAYGITLRRRAK